MAADVPFSRKRKPHGFMSVLSFAACEWLLMFLLFLDAAFWYLLGRFARYCELEPPCLLCSRFDHGFGKKKPTICWSLLCSNHREEISSLVSCSVHCKFGDVHSMCEECLISFTMQKNFNSLHNMTCSCCNNALRAKSNSERLIELDPLRFGDSRANIRPSLVRTPVSSRFNRRDSLKKLREKFAGTLTDQSAQGTSTGADAMSNVAYTKLKLSSDSESEFAHSEDDDEGNTDIEHILHDPPSDTNALEIQTGQGLEVKPLDLDQPHKVDSSDHKNGDPLSSDANTEHFEDLDREECYYKRSSSLTRKLISLCDSFPPRDVAAGTLTEKFESSSSLPHLPAISVKSEVMSVCSVPPLSSDTTPEKEDAGETSENGELYQNNHVEAARIDASIRGAEALEVSSRNAFEPTSTRGSANIEEDEEELSTSDMKNYNYKLDESRTGENLDSHVLPVASSSETKHSYILQDEISVSDIEGENIIDQLKRQIEHYHECLNSLYKELEAERNASAIAIEEAMAMITRLQEEKAALRMEALHYLRAMEEQAAYDAQALEKANDLLAERERELQDLEYELEAYRNNYLDEPDEDDEVQEALDLDNQSAGHAGMSPGASSN